MNDYASLRQSIGGQSSSLQMVAQNHARTYKNAIESLSQSPLPAHRDLAVSLQRNSNMWNYNSQPGLIPHHQQTNSTVIYPDQGIYMEEPSFEERIYHKVNDHISQI